MSTYGMPKVINCSMDEGAYFILPRGCRESLEELFQGHSVNANIVNQQYEGETIDVKFQGHLTSQQQDAIAALLEYDKGILSAATGFGKTVTAQLLSPNVRSILSLLYIEPNSCSNGLSNFLLF
jgi:superfamily II DNA or RNA helicase